MLMHHLLLSMRDVLGVEPYKKTKVTITFFILIETRESCSSMDKHIVGLHVVDLRNAQSIQVTYPENTTYYIQQKLVYNTYQLP